MPSVDLRADSMQITKYTDLIKLMPSAKVNNLPVIIKAILTFINSTVCPDSGDSLTCRCAS